MGHNPPPREPLVGAVEEVAGRVVSEHRVDIMAMEAVARQAELSMDESHMAEQLVRAYAGGSARAAQHRRDEMAAKARQGRKGGAGG